MTIYDRNDKPGGMLRYSVPEFRLPESVLERELEPLWKAGVRFVDGVALGSEVTLEGLLQAGIDAVFVGVGAWQTAAAPAWRAPRPRSTASTFLRALREGRKPRLAKTVAVIGDGIYRARRGPLGRAPRRRSVTVHRPCTAPTPCRPAPAAFVAARDEGIEFVFTAEAKKIAADRSGKATGVECVALTAGDRRQAARRARLELRRAGRHRHHRRRLHPRRGRLRRASSASRPGAPSRPTSSPAAPRPPRRLCRRRRRLRRRSRRSTRWPPASAPPWPWTPGWPAMTSTASRPTSLSTPACPISSSSTTPSKLTDVGRKLVETSPVWLKMGVAAPAAPRVKMPTVPVAKRVAGFDEVEKGLSPAQAKAEAARCLQCVCPFQRRLRAAEPGRRVVRHRATTSWSRAAWCARSSRPTSIPSSAAT